MLVGSLGITAVPFAVWGVLGVIARVRKISLRAALPWLRALRWLVWLIGMPLVVAAVASHKYFWLFPIGMSLATASVPFGAAESWVKRRYAPDSSTSASDG